MLNHWLKYSILGVSFLANLPAYAITTNFSETYAGTFSLSGSDLAYNLVEGDGNYPTLNSVSSVVPGSFKGNGTFTRTEQDGDTFFGNYNFDIYQYTQPNDGGPFSIIYYYAGDINITGGTGSYLNATGNGTFTGADSYFAILIEDENLEAQMFRAFAANEPPLGTSLQKINWQVTFDDKVSPVPVPAAAWLLGSSLLAYVGLRRKSKVSTI